MTENEKTHDQNAEGTLPSPAQPVAGEVENLGDEAKVEIAKSGGAAGGTPQHDGHPIDGRGDGATGGTTPKNAKAVAIAAELKHPAAFLRFVAWIAIPDAYRNPKSQEELAKEVGVDPATLSDWKKRTGFWDAVHDEMRHFLRGRTANVMVAFYNAILREGDAARIRAWWEIVEGWTPKQKVAFAGVIAVEQVKHATNDELHRIIELAEALRRGEGGAGQAGAGAPAAAEIHPIQLPALPAELAP